MSEAVYLHNPDENGVELYIDRPREEWKVVNNRMVEMVTEPFDLNSILKELDNIVLNYESYDNPTYVDYTSQMRPRRFKSFYSSKK